MCQVVSDDMARQGNNRKDSEGRKIFYSRTNQNSFRNWQEGPSGSRTSNSSLTNAPFAGYEGTLILRTLCGVHVKVQTITEILIPKITLFSNVIDVTLFYSGSILVVLMNVQFVFNLRKDRKISLLKEA